MPYPCAASRLRIRDTVIAFHLPARGAGTFAFRIEWEPAITQDEVVDYVNAAPASVGRSSARFKFYVGQYAKKEK